MSKNFLFAIFVIGCEIHYHISKQGADTGTGRMQSGAESRPVCAVALSPDGQHIFSSSDDLSVQYMCVQTFRPNVSLLHTRRIVAGGFEANGSEPIQLASKWLLPMLG